MEVFGMDGGGDLAVEAGEAGQGQAAACGAGGLVGDGGRDRGEQG